MIKKYSVCSFSFSDVLLWCNDCNITDCRCVGQSSVPGMGALSAENTSIITMLVRFFTVHCKLPARKVRNFLYTVTDYVHTFPLFIFVNKINEKC